MSVAATDGCCLPEPCVRSVGDVFSGGGRGTQALLPPLPTAGVWSQVARGHLGKEQGRTQPPRKVDPAGVPAPTGDLVQPLLLRGPGVGCGQK